MKLKRLVIKEELVALTSDAIAALILNQFIYWSERTKDTDEYIEEERKRDPSINIPLTHGWIYKSSEQLYSELLTASAKTIARKLEKLVQSGWIDRRNNPNHKWDRTYQYRPNMVKIQTDLQSLGYTLEGYPIVIHQDKPTECIRQNVQSISQKVQSNGQSVQAITENNTETKKQREMTNSPVPSLDEKRKTDGILITPLLNVCRLNQNYLFDKHRITIERVINNLRNLHPNHPEEKLAMMIEGFGRWWPKFWKSRSGPPTLEEVINEWPRYASYCKDELNGDLPK